MPDSPKTPARPFRIRDELYKPALAKARAQGVTLTSVVERALEEFLEED